MTGTLSRSPHTSLLGTSPAASVPAPSRREHLGVALLALLLGWSMLALPLGLDQGIYATAAARMLDGGALYTDAWDMKSPGIFFFYEVPIALGGFRVWPIFAAVLLTHILTSVALFRLAWWLGGGLWPGAMSSGESGPHPADIGYRRAFAWASAALYMIHAAAWGNPISLGQPDDLMLAPYLLAALLLAGEWLVEIDELRWWRPYLAGLLMGWVLLLRSTMLIGVVALPLFVFALELHRSAARVAWGAAPIGERGGATPPRRRFALFSRLTGWYVAGGASIGLAAIAYFVATGSFGDLWYSQFVWVRQYAQTLFSWDALTLSSIYALLHKEWWHYFADWAIFRWSIPFGALALGAWWLIRGRRATGDGAAPSTAWAIAVWGALMLLATSSSLLQLKFFNYHWWPVLPFWMMSAALAIVVAATPCVWLWRRGNVAASSSSTPAAMPASVGRRWRWRTASIALGVALLLGLFDPGALFPFEGPGLFVARVHAGIHHTHTGLREYKEHVQRTVQLLTGDEAPANYVARFSFEHIYRPQEEMQLAERILRETPEGDRPPRLFIWGFRPALYFLTGSGGPSRFAYNLPLRASWSPPEWLEHVEEEVMADPPDWIVMGRGDDFYWVVGNHGLSETTRPAWLVREMDAHFERVEVLKFLELWQRRTSGANRQAAE